MTDRINLWLDDIRPAPEGWVRVKTVHEAIEVMRTKDVDHMSLDHDLDLCPTCHDLNEDYSQDILLPCKCNQSTGYDFVKWMAGNDIWPKFKPTVHSANPVGANNMRAMIDRYGPWR